MSAKKLRKGKMRYLLIALTFLLCFSVRLYAATWVQLDDDNFIDKDSIKRYANDRSELQLNKKIVWMKLLNTNNVYEPFEKDYKKKVAFSLSQLIFDLSRNQIATKSITLYDQNGASIYSHTSRDYELKWEAIIPNSKGEYWAYLIKKPSLLKKMYKYQTTIYNSEVN